MLEQLLINLDLRLNEITEDSQIYDNCVDALDLIAKDRKASKIYKNICNLINFEMPEELKEILQTYDIEIKNYHNLVEKNK